MSLKIALAQINFLVGNITANVDNIIKTAIYARDELSADIVVFPELTITGYPAEDLLFRSDFIEVANNAIYQIADGITDVAVVVGFPERDGDNLYNSAAVLYQGVILACYRKQALPNYGVFDEQRYFEAGINPCVFDVAGTKFGVNICADVWEKGAVTRAKEAGADVLLVMNASPYHMDKQATRYELIRQRISETGMAIVYINLVGGQDELVFDGSSFAMNRQGELTHQFGEFTEALGLIELQNSIPLPGEIEPRQVSQASIYHALCLGVKDYVGKNQFPGV